MITEKIVKEFEYYPGDIEEGSFLLTGDAQIPHVNYNRSRCSNIIQYLDADLAAFQRKIAADAFQGILLGEKTDWKVIFIEPLPATINFRLRHRGAFIYDFDGADVAKDEMTSSEFNEAESILDLFGGPEVNISLSSMDEHFLFRLSLEEGEQWEFSVNPKSTSVEISNYRINRHYNLTWSNKEHTRFIAQISSTFRI